MEHRTPDEPGKHHESVDAAGQRLLTFRHDIAICIAYALAYNAHAGGAPFSRLSGGLP